MGHHNQDLLKQEYRDNGKFKTTGPEFTKDCKSLKVLQLFYSLTCRKFGKVATSSHGLTRLIDSLATKTGLKKVEACWTNRIPLEGRGAEHIGIAECNALWATFEKTKSGGDAPAPTGPPATSAAGVDMSAEPSAQVVDALTQLSEIVGAPQAADGGAGMSEDDAADIREALAKVESIPIIKASDTSTIDARVQDFQGKKALILMEAPSSRKSVQNILMDLAKRIGGGVNRHDSLTVITPCHGDIAKLGDILEKLNLVFAMASGWRTQLVQLARSTD